MMLLLINTSFLLMPKHIEGKPQAIKDEITSLIAAAKRNAPRDPNQLTKSLLNLESSLGPRPIKLTGKAVAWLESKIVEWLASREAA